MILTIGLNKIIFKLIYRKQQTMLSAHDNANQSIMVLCPFNYFSQDMVNFYLLADGENQIQTYQYPQLPVDTYTPTLT